MMSPYPAVMKHDFESLYFLILQISNDGGPSNNCWATREMSI